MGLNDNISDLGRLFQQFGMQGSKFDFWQINGYSTPEGEDVEIENGVCVTVDSGDGEAYAEWVFDATGALEQFAVWHRGSEFVVPFPVELEEEEELVDDELCPNGCCYGVCVEEEEESY
jgi:hypothetical protein